MASLIAQVALLKQEFQPDIVHVNFPASAAFHHLQSIRPGEATVALFHCALDDWPQIWPLARSLAETADAVAVPSRFLAGNVAAVLSKPPEAFRVIEHGVPEAPLVSISPLPELPSPRFLFAGRLALKKGLIVGFAAIEALARRGIAAELAVAGAGPLDSMLATLPADPVLADRVIVLGELSPDRLVKCLSAATALLVPSLSKESFSLISAEAALAGRPVLASRRGALAETVVDGETGLLFEPGAPTSLADAMQRVLFEPGLAARLGSAARERARSRYGLSLMVDRYETLYRHLAKRPA
jgi:glycosyltransferase involved in cell wall biosynthesis